MIGRCIFLFLGDDHALTLHAHEHLVLSHLEIIHAHLGAFFPGREQGGLVDEVGQIGA
jgi:hypothetical protein